MNSTTSSTMNTPIYDMCYVPDLDEPVDCSILSFDDHEGKFIQLAIIPPLNNPELLTHLGEWIKTSKVTDCDNHDDLREEIKRFLSNNVREIKQ